MSDERSISVAELLARNGGNGSAASGRRRRHRGGENSISVAELTGEIPVVRDAGRDAGTEQSDEAAAAPAADAAASTADTAASTADATAAAEQVEAPQAEAAQAADQAEAEPAEAKEADGAQAAGAQAAGAAAADAGDADEDERTTTSSPLAAAVADTVTGRFEAITAHERGAGDVAEAAEAEVDEARTADASSARASEGADTRAWSQWSEGAAPMATADFNTAQVREREERDRRAAQAWADTDGADADATSEAPAEGGPSVPDTNAMSVQQIADAKAAGELDDDTEAAAPAGDADEKAPARSGGRAGKGWLMLLAEVVLGLVAGAGLFYGFYQLWNWGGGTWTIALAVVLAFVVIIAIVTFTHYLRKTTDFLTLGLALFVGLVVTFGPLLMSLGQN